MTIVVFISGLSVPLLSAELCQIQNDFGIWNPFIQSYESFEYFKEYSNNFPNNHFLRQQHKSEEIQHPCSRGRLWRNVEGPSVAPRIHFSTSFT